MKGCRPLTTNEMAEVATVLGAGHNGVRNQCLFTLGLMTGFRVSELLSIRVEDVVQHGNLASAVTVARRNMKGKGEGRTVRLNEKAQIALALWLDVGPETGPLFQISRVQVWRILNKAFATIGMTGKLGTHCMRKTFADRIYDHFDGELIKVQKALGHKWVTTTSAYISFKQEDIDEAIDAL